jgi:hypothetical protein
VIRIWDVRTGSQALELVGHEGIVRAVGLARNGESCVSADDEGTVIVWQLATGRDRLRIGAGFAIKSLAISPDGHRAIVGGNRGNVAAIDLSKGKEARRFEGHELGITSVGFWPDGKTIVTASEDKAIKVWHDAFPNPVATFLGHSSSVTSIEVSSDGFFAVSASIDGTCRLWETASGREVSRIESPDLQFFCARFSPISNEVAVVSSNGTAAIYACRWVDELPPNSSPLDKCWEDLAGASAAAATRASARFTYEGAHGVRFIRERLAGVVQDPARVQELILKLEDNDVANRERAVEELEWLAPATALREMLQKDPSLELGQRIQTILQGIEGPVVRWPEGRRTLRCIWILERIGTSDAKEILQALGKGLSSRQTRISCAALERVNQKGR